MKFNDAVFLIEGCCEQMTGLYGTPMFDEWLIADFKQNTGKVIYYSGPRHSEFETKFGSDVGGLVGILAEHDYQPGNIEFARLSGGSRYDVLITISPRIYLICNHTKKSMLQIRQNSAWVKAVVPLLELADKFQRDPLVSETL